MQGYGQAPMQNQQLAELLAQQQMTQQRQQSAQGLMDNNGSTGLAGILGAALGGYMNKKKGDMIASGNVDIGKQIAQMQAESEAQIKAAKEAQEAKKWAREDAIRAEKRGYQIDDKLTAQEQAMEMMQAQQGFTAGQNDLNRQSSNNRFEQSYGLDQERLAMQKQAMAQKQAPQQFTPDEQMIIKAGKATPEQIMQVKADKALGVDSKKQKAEQEMKRKLSGSVNELFRQLQDEGTETWGSDSKKMSTTYNDLLLQAKEAYNLGVLSGPDLELMEKVINDPTSFSSGANPFAAGNIKTQLSEFAKRFELQDPAEAYKALSEEPETPEIAQQNKMLFKYSRNK